MLAVLVLASHPLEARTQDRPVRNGDPARVVEVVFSGFDVLSSDRLNALKKAAPLQPDTPVDPTNLEETLRLAATTLQNAGYARPRVEAYETVVAPGRVRIDIKADPGLQAVFGPIEITGNLTVEDAIIRRRLTYRPGERFQVAAMQESQRRLAALGLFESVDISIVDGERVIGGVATRATVKERDPTQFTYSFGYGSEERVYGEAAWRHLNFSGGARALSTRGKWSSLDRGAEGAFAQPDVGRPGLVLTTNAYVWEFNETPFNALSEGARVAVSYPKGRTTLSSAYTHEFRSVEIPTDAQNNLESQAQLARLGVDTRTGEQKGVLSALQVSAERDTTAESGAGSRGSALGIRLEQAGRWLPGSFHYISVFGDGRYYRPVHRVTLAGRIQYGSIVAAERPSDVPLSKRYFLGGADSLRGWGRFEVSPLSATGLPFGGRSLFATTGEVRLPVSGPIGTVVFVDAGNVWEDSWMLARDLHADAGVGLRYRSRWALLRFDFAHQLTRMDGLQIGGERRDRRWRMHFGIGQSF